VTAGVPGRARKRAPRWLIALALAAPALVFLVVFYVVPLGYMVAESLHPWRGDGGDERIVSIEQYGKVAKGGRTVRAFERTVRIAAIATAASFVVSYPIALLLLGAGRRLRTSLLLVVFVSLASSLLVRNYGWLVTLSDTGPLNRLFITLGIVDAPVRMVYSEGAIIVALVHYTMPFMILPVFASLLRIPASYTEAAQSLGAGPFRALAGIVLPLSIPGIFGGTLLTFAICMSAFVTPLMLGSPSTSMISQVAAEQFLVQLNFPFGSAVIVSLTTATFAIVAAYTLAVRRVFRAQV
jgi:ABC-type spermidine/putrescine transport system permease subunit I